MTNHKTEDYKISVVKYYFNDKGYGYNKNGKHIRTHIYSFSL